MLIANIVFTLSVLGDTTPKEKHDAITLYPADCAGPQILFVVVREKKIDCAHSCSPECSTLTKYLRHSASIKIS